MYYFAAFRKKLHWVKNYLNYFMLYNPCRPKKSGKSSELDY